MVLDAVRSGSYRGRLAADEPVEGKLEPRPAAWWTGSAPPCSRSARSGARRPAWWVTWPASATPAELGVTRRVTEELGVDTGKVATRVFGRPKLDALYSAAGRFLGGCGREGDGDQTALFCFDEDDAAEEVEDNMAAWRRGLKRSNAARSTGSWWERVRRR
ncbi:unnamed protein product [Miscanthus lutarioriparius]|uniref:Uncharacterized protein n=1 Tax=Miscanthus lutarioriparius TaxID=422564 RepID=A0A811PWJ1_9POAL|nr:unnamed protein product [Miscanthus lutarioriparius]